MDALNRLDDYLQRRPMPLRLWLRKTTHERLLDVHRRHRQAVRREVGREVGLPERSSLQLARHLWASGTSPSGQAARREFADRVRAAVVRLPELDREILLMRALEGMSYEDVGQILEISPTAARKRYGRALLRLQKYLPDTGTTG